MIVNDVYAHSRAVRVFAKLVRSASAGDAVRRITIEFTKNRELDVANGRFVDTGYGEVGWNLVRGHPERAQEPGQRLDRPHGRVGGVPAQVHIQLVVGKAVADPVHGQCRLPTPAVPVMTEITTVPAALVPSSSSSPRSCALRAVYFLAGVGHAFVAPAEDTVMCYLISGGYVPENELALSPFDPALGLSLPAGLVPILSERDRVAPTLTEAEAAGLLPRYADYSRSRCTRSATVQFGRCRSGAAAIRMANGR
ncbi:dTDP-4-dehydrorhamnose 3,5-epimerase family protein [Amycolatopsis aidingensis]|uniref:dTDP-4-dehydrorhamnose 3,5-epimerase family protein n=1 Tax=Amycolatopsis aidingensis TaxID=2842453 RepID=UPI001E356E5B|nr:dTDP-4-dehydrorhamnose 3,5-epimerase family protein [Amycolatopsis aidingensis]